MILIYDIKYESYSYSTMNVHRCFNTVNGKKFNVIRMGGGGWGVSSIDDITDDGLYMSFICEQCIKNLRITWTMP